MLNYCISPSFKFQKSVRGHSSILCLLFVKKIGKEEMQEDEGSGGKGEWGRRSVPVFLTFKGAHEPIPSVFVA
jgi:hypothetical protein